MIRKLRFTEWYNIYMLSCVSNNSSPAVSPTACLLVFTLQVGVLMPYPYLWSSYGNVTLINRFAYTNNIDNYKMLSSVMQFAIKMVEHIPISLSRTSCSAFPTTILFLHIRTAYDYISYFTHNTFNYLDSHVLIPYVSLLWTLLLIFIHITITTTIVTYIHIL